MAGLTAAYELSRAGHEVDVFEARHRVGGRIETLREPFSPGLYAEAAAMRIPASHGLVNAYLRRFALPTAPFTSWNPNAFAYLQGRRERLTALETDSRTFDYGLTKTEQAHPVRARWESLLAPLREKIRAHGQTAWSELVSAYESYSIEQFLLEAGWSRGAIEFWALVSQQESRLHTSCLELLREEVGGYHDAPVEIVGGSDRLPLALADSLMHRVRFGARLVAVDQSPTEVTLHLRSEAEDLNVRADFAVITLPFPVLRGIEMLKPLSRGKQRAIRELHYDAAAKVLLQFRRRFWEKDDGIRGGLSITDLPLRGIYYPEHGEETGRGVLLASYTWGEEALGWQSLPAQERISQALRELSRLHPQARHEFETGYSKAWAEDEYAVGGFALFQPGQQTQLYEHIVRPEGRLYFAGEHCSLFHGWIEGAVESALRATLAIHMAAQ
jgi:monoamine oxidase